MAEEADGVKSTEEIDTSTTESPTEETNDDGVISLTGDIEFKEKETEEVKEQGEADADESAEDETKAQAPESKTEDTSSKNAETRKQQLNNEIRDKVAERNALRKEIAELNRQKYQMKTTSDIPTVEALMEQINPETNDYYTRTEAKLARIEAERELEREARKLDEYTDNIVDNRMRLKDEADRVLKDFPMFDESSSSYDKNLAEKAEKIAEGMLIRDNSGEVIGSRGSIYDVYALVAEAVKSAGTNGEIAGRRAAEKMMGSADIIGSSSPKATGDDDNDPFLKGLRRGLN